MRARPALDPTLLRPRKSEVRAPPMAAPASSTITSHAVGPPGGATAGSCCIRASSALRPETLDFRSSRGDAMGPADQHAVVRHKPDAGGDEKGKVARRAG